VDVVDFLTLERAEFEYGEPQWVAPLVRRVVAENPSKFTYHGTGTYLIGDGHGDVVVIDPGPTLDSHRDALAAALRGQTVRAVLVTHCHADHSPLSAWLASESGASTFAFGPHGDDEWDIGDDPPGLDDDGGNGDAGTSAEPVIEESTDRDFVPDVAVRSGDVVASGPSWRMQALHTPGHTSNHTCFTLDDGSTRTLFTGDHVMGWSTTVVAPPDGDMDAYLDSLRSVAGRHDDLAIPTHGPPIPRPGTFVGALVDHRLQRERQVLDVVRGGTADIPTMVEVLYADVRRELHKPARRSVLAHLVKLAGDGVVAVDGGGRPRLDSSYRPV
jgi:glyoxylase-like metal-dependent hydrolase (beta-lactamase superfamily II)